MFIRNCLSDLKQLTVVKQGDTIEAALKNLAGHLSLPCTDGENTFLGMISKRTIFEALQPRLEQGETYSELIKDTVEACIDRSIKPLTLLDRFEDTIDIIIRHPFVPIVEDGKLQGIVKRSDVNRALSIAFATNVDADRLLVGMAEVEGSLERLFNVTHRLGINVITAVPFDAGINPLNRRVILKVSRTPRLQTLIEQLGKNGFMIIDSTQ